MDAEHRVARQLRRLESTEQRSSPTWAAYEQFNSDGSGAAELFLTGFGEPQGLKSLGVTGNLFRVLGAAPLIGRTFTDDETYEGKSRVVISATGSGKASSPPIPRLRGRQSSSAAAPTTWSV